MSRHSRLTEAQIIDALRKGAGIAAAAATILSNPPPGGLGIPTKADTLRKRILRSPKLRAACDTIREDSLDLAESKVLTGIRNGDRTFTIFFLKCHGKSRGWVEKAEPTADNPLPVSVTNTGELARAVRGMDAEQLRAALSPTGLRPRDATKPPPEQ